MVDCVKGCVRMIEVIIVVCLCIFGFITAYIIMLSARGLGAMAYNAI